MFVLSRYSATLYANINSPFGIGGQIKEKVMRQTFLAVCVAAIVGICLTSCGQSGTEEEYVGMKMNKQLIEKVMAEVQTLEEDPEVSDISVLDLGGLLELRFKSDRPLHRYFVSYFYNKDGEKVAELEDVDEVGPSDCGVFLVNLGSTVGYMNTKGEVVVAPGKYAKGSSCFWHGVAAVCDENRNWGIIRTDGTELFPLEYTEAKIYPNGLIFLSRDNQDRYEAAIFKSDGTEVMPFQPSLSVEAWNGTTTYDEDYLLNDIIIVNTVAEGDDTRYNFCSIDGKGQIEEIGKFCEMDEFDKHKVARVRAAWDSKICGFVNADGKLIIPCEYIYLENRDEEYGKVMANKEGKVGVFGYDGNILWPFENEEVYSFNKELACVKRGDQWQVIDHDGNSLNIEGETPVFGKCYQTGTDRAHGLATVTGKEILAPTHSWFEDVPRSRIVYAVNDHEYFNYDTGEQVLEGMFQQYGDVYNSTYSFDPDGYAIYSQEDDAKYKTIVGPDGEDLILGGEKVERIGKFYVGDNKVYYKGKEVADIKGFVDVVEGGYHSRYCGGEFLDGIFVFGFDHKGKYTYFINKKGIVTKVNGYINPNLACRGIDVRRFFHAYMHRY